MRLVNINSLAEFDSTLITDNLLNIALSKGTSHIPSIILNTSDVVSICGKTENPFSLIISPKCQSDIFIKEIQVDLNSLRDSVIHKSIRLVSHKILFERKEGL